jgi:hypothetical protein
VCHPKSEKKQHVPRTTAKTRCHRLHLGCLERQNLMAIQTLSFISLILRPYVKQPISTDGWKTLFAQVDPHCNFDGELVAF